MNASAIRRASNFTLANGASIPKLGLGTWKAPKGQVGPAVSHALKTGFRHIDCAWAYRNEDEVGEAIKSSGIPRQQLWITSKLWNSFHHPDHVEKGLDATLKDLGTDHLDLFLMHWPVAFLNSNGSQIASVKGQDGKPIEDVSLSNDISSTWSKMEEMVSKGKVRNIGISNFNIRRTDELLKESKIKPVVNQVEVNWGVPNEELLAWSEAHGIKLQGYSPLGSNNNVERYLNEPVIQDVAARNHLTPAQVFLSWSLGRGIITLPKSVTPSRLEENFKVLEVELPQADIDLLTREAQNKPIERTVDPTEGWGVEKDIFEDGLDQRRAGELKSENYKAPLPHENKSREHYLDPNHDSSSNNHNPSGSRSIHTQSNNNNHPSSSSSSSRRSTPIQTLLGSSGLVSFSRRNFSTSSKVKATTAEAQPPSASEAPGISTSSLLLRTSDKEAKATPGLRWTDEDSRSGESRKMNMYTAIRDAQSLALGSDETACVFGEDVAFGGVFRSTMGLAEEYGRERVFNTPLSEQGIIGFAIGMATMGHTAIAEIQFADYIFPAFDQLVNEAAKYNYRSGGQHKAGKLTVRSPCQGVGHGALYHSQSVEQFFMPVPGLKVVMPRSPIQAKGLLLSSIRDPNPVIFLEPKVLYRSSVEQVPLDDFTLPLSSAEVLQTGNDITLLSWGAPLYSCEQAIQMLRNPPKSIEEHIPKEVRNANVELIDLRTILPWDRETIVKSVMKTGRCVIVHEAPVTAGVGAEIGSHLQENCFLRLEAPVCRVGGWDSPFPHVHETFYKPEQIRIVDALVRTLSY